MSATHDAGFDELAHILRDMASRFGENAFTDRRRLVSILADRLPEDRRDIRGVAGAAVDERVFDALTRARPEQLPLEIERMATRLQNGLGIRSDLAVPVVHACAYGLSLGPLPSEASRPAPSAPEPARNDGWVGVSEPVIAPATHVATAREPARAASEMLNTARNEPKRKGMPTWLKWGGGGVVAVLAVLLALSVRVVPENPGSAPQPAPTPAPAPTTTTSPTPAPAPVVEPAPPVRPPPPALQAPVPQAPAIQAPVPQAPAPQSAVFGEEDADFHVPPQTSLRPNNQVGTPTPLTLPGATRVTTVQVFNEMNQSEQQRGAPLLLLDAWGDPHPETIRGAQALPGANQGGSFNDAVQAQVARELGALTRGRKDAWLVFFCQGVQCWESYNAALRARAAGYTNIFWYRGGLFAWNQAGLPTQPAR